MELVEKSATRPFFRKINEKILIESDGLYFPFGMKFPMTPNQIGTIYLKVVNIIGGGGGYAWIGSERDD